MADTNGARQAAGMQDSSAGDLVKQMSEQVSRLIRDELKLAEIEMTRKGARAGRGIVMSGGGGIIAVYGIGCLLAAAVVALATALSAWLAAVIVGAALLATAAIAALLGRSQLKKATPPGPAQAVHSVKADIREIRARARR